MCSMVLRTRSSLGHDEPVMTGGDNLFPCGNGKCSKEVSKESISCDACNVWYHLKCSGLTRASFQTYHSNKRLKWICRSCFRVLHEALSKMDRGCSQGTQLSLGQEVTCLTPTAANVEGNTGLKVQPLSSCVDLDASQQTVGSRKKRRGKRRRIDEEIPSVTKDTGEHGTSSEVNNKGTWQETKLSGESSDFTIARKAEKGKKASRLTGPAQKEKQSKGDQTTKAAILQITRRLDEQAESLRKLREEKEELSRTIDRIGRHSEVALGRTRNVLIKGISEPFMRYGRHRDRYMRSEVSTLLRGLGIQEHVLIKRVLRLGPWRNDLDGEPKPSRPIVVEFGNPRHRDRFLAGAEKIRATSGGKIVVTPDDTAHNLPVRVLLDRAGNFPRAVMSVQKLQNPPVTLETNGSPVRGKLNSRPVSPEKTFREILEGDAGRQVKPKNGGNARV